MAARQIDLYDKQRRLAWYLIIPAVLVVVLVIGYPLAQVVVYSFLKYKLDGVTPEALSALTITRSSSPTRTGGVQFGIR